MDLSGKHHITDELTAAICTLLSRFSDKQETKRVFGKANRAGIDVMFHVPSRTIRFQFCTHQKFALAVEFSIPDFAHSARENNDGGETYIDNMMNALLNKLTEGQKQRQEDNVIRVVSWGTKEKSAGNG